jgi:hypothetical protein
MENLEYIQQLSDIKKILNERTKFNALSGISGVLAGSYALVGSLAAHHIITSSKTILYDDFASREYNLNIVRLFIIAGLVLFMSIFTGLYFSISTSRKRGERFWTKVTKKIIIELFLFMVVAGFLLLFSYLRGYLTLLSPLSLLFYGLALIHVSGFINGEVRSLGLSLIGVGILSLFIPGYGLYCWAFGFGVLHIIYGFLMWYKYEREA